MSGRIMLYSREPRDEFNGSDLSVVAVYDEQVGKRIAITVAPKAIRLE